MLQNEFSLIFSQLCERDYEKTQAVNISFYAKALYSLNWISYELLPYGPTNS